MDDLLASMRKNGSYLMQDSDQVSLDLMPQDCLFMLQLLRAIIAEICEVLYSYTGISLAETSRQLRHLGRPKNGLRSHQGDARATTNSPGSHGDVSTTSLQHRRNVSSVSDRSRRHRRDVSPVMDKISLHDIAATDGNVTETRWKMEKVSKKNRACLNFPRLPGDLASLQETSQRCLRNQWRLESPPGHHQSPGQ
ncbi:uncharacterized protein [Narcine bancroftii]|uniref:uncharacterized protein isoform X2 n=1 Tax=Narcine bancroftii TaxID=1343680 RepID=UPI003831642E